eukprot:606593_1
MVISTRHATDHLLIHHRRILFLSTIIALFDLVCVYKNQFNTDPIHTPWNRQVEALNDVINILIPDTYGPTFAQFHRRLARYIAVFCMYMSSDRNAEDIRHIISKINVLFDAKSTDEITNDIHEFEPLANTNALDSNQILSSMANTKRVLFYVIISTLFYIVIAASFWICFVLFEFSDSLALRMFYMGSYAIYFVFLFASMWLLHFEYKSYVRDTYGWLIPVTYGRRLEVDRNEFLKVYYTVLCGRITSKCLRKLFDNNHEWMLDIVLEYVFDMNLEKIFGNVHKKKLNYDYPYLTKIATKLLQDHHLCRGLEGMVTIISF